MPSPRLDLETACSASRYVPCYYRRGGTARPREFGATEIVEQCGEDGVATVKELIGGLGGHSVIEPSERRRR